MLTVLYWNLAKNAATLSRVARLAGAHGVDALFLAEPPKLAPVLADLNALGIGTFREIGLPPLKVAIISRLSKKVLRHTRSNLAGDVGACLVKTSSLPDGEIILAPVHLPSKAGGKTESGQASSAIDASGSIAGFEDGREHQNTIAFGDFNMSPFDAGMTLVTGMHGLMTVSLAGLPDRGHRGEKYRRFYNPMWGLLGDRTGGPPGSYFWESTEIENHHWYMLDQVLIRPALVPRVTGPTILDTDGTDSLLSADGVPSKAHLSDHLPILFSVNIDI